MGIIGLNGLINTTEKNADTSSGSVQKKSTVSTKAETYTQQTSEAKTSPSDESAATWHNKLGKLFAAISPDDRYDSKHRVRERNPRQEIRFRGAPNIPTSGSNLQTRLRNILGRFSDSGKKGRFFSR